RLLELKARLGLHEERLVSLDAVDAVVGSGAHLAFADSAATRSITLVRDAHGLVPLTRPDAVVTVDPRSPLVHVRYAPSSWLWAGNVFLPGLRQRVPGVRHVSLDERSDSAAYAAAAEVVASATDAGGRVLVTAYVSPAAGSGPDALPERFRSLLADHADPARTILVSLGNPYLLSALPDVGTYLIGWGDREVSQRAALAALFGEEAISGRLPIPLPPHAVGDGLDRARSAERVTVDVVDDPLVAAGI